VTTLDSLSLVGRHIELAVIDRMQRTALELARQGPFHAEMLRYLDQMPPAASTRLSPDANRAMLLVTLDEVLASLAPCANRQATSHLDLLRRHYRVLVSPLAEVAELTQYLLRLATHVPYQQGPIRYDPFRPLLNVYVDLHARLEKLETEVPRDALAAIEFQISLLAKVLPVDMQDALRRIEQELDRLSESRFSQRDLPRPYCRNQSVVWH
jgi:hypothetical protein